MVRIEHGRHKKTNGAVDDGTSEVQPIHWNDDHKQTGIVGWDGIISTLVTDAFLHSEGVQIIASESGTVDDLVTITATDSQDNDFLQMYADAGDTITVKHGTGNIELYSGIDIDLSETVPMLVFRRGSNWYEFPAEVFKWTAGHDANSNDLTTAKNILLDADTTHLIDLTRTTPQSDDYVIGEIRFRHDDEVPALVNYARITGVMLSDAVGAEEGEMHFYVMDTNVPDKEYMNFNDAGNGKINIGVNVINRAGSFFDFHLNNTVKMAIASSETKFFNNLGMVNGNSIQWDSSSQTAINYTNVTGFLFTVQNNEGIELTINSVEEFVMDQNGFRQISDTIHNWNIQRSASLADDTEIGSLNFRAFDDSGSLPANFARISGVMENDEAVAEDGSLHFYVMQNNSLDTEFMNFNDLGDGFINVFKTINAPSFFDVNIGGINELSISGAEATFKARLGLQSGNSIRWQSNPEKRILYTNGIGFEFTLPSDEDFEFVRDSKSVLKIIASGFATDDNIIHNWDIARDAVITNDTEIGELRFRARNDVDVPMEDYALLKGFVRNEAQGSEAGQIEIHTMQNGIMRLHMELNQLDGQTSFFAGTVEVLEINDSSIIINDGHNLLMGADTFDGFIELGELDGDAGTPAINKGRIFLKLVTDHSEPFYVDEAGSVTNMISSEGEANITGNVGGGTFSLRGSTPKSGVTLNLITITNGDGMNAVLATDVLTLAVDSTVVQTNKINTFGDFNQFFRDGKFIITDPTNSFNYNFITSNIASSKGVTLPLLISADTFVFENHIQPLTNKSFDNTNIFSAEITTTEIAGVTAEATEGIFWTRDDIPTSAMFTDDSDVDYRINPRASIQFVIDGGGVPIVGGIKGDLEIPNNFEIEEVTMLADQTGSIIVDIWMEQLVEYPPTDADSITASAVPTITTDDNSQDTSLTGWTTSLVGRETLRYNVDGTPTDIERVTISLWGRWT